MIRNFEQQQGEKNKAYFHSFYKVITDNPVYFEYAPWIYQDLANAVFQLVYCRLTDPSHIYSILDKQGYIVPLSEIEKYQIKVELI